MKTKRDPPGRGWFRASGRKGIVHLERQIAGLDLISAAARDKTVLDLGCAEGEVSRWLVQRGASFVDGIDYNTTRIQAGRAMDIEAINLTCADLNRGRPAHLRASYDIVLLLAVLQKMRDPARLLQWASFACREWLAIRAPAAIIRDRRSRFAPLDIKARLSAGFELMQESAGHPGYSEDETWLGIFHRSKH